MWRIVFLFLMLPMVVWGESWKEHKEGGFSVEISISQNELTIEDTLEVSLILKFPETHDIAIDSLRRNILKYVGLSEPPFSLMSEKVSRKETGTVEIEYQLEPQLEGVHFLSLYNITFAPKDPNLHEPVDIISKIFQVEVTIPMVEEERNILPSPLLSLTQQFPLMLTGSLRQRLFNDPELQEKEIEKNVTILRQRTFPWAQLVGIVLIAVIVLIIRIQPKRIPPPEKEERRRSKIARSKALQDLQILRKRDYLQQNDFDAFYTDLTTIVRRYIEERYQVRVTTQTTQEFLFSLKNFPLFDLETQSRLEQFLISSDRVKFAEHEPQPEHCQAAQEMAKAFIEQH